METKTISINGKEIVLTKIPGTIDSWKDKNSYVKNTNRLTGHCEIIHSIIEDDSEIDDSTIMHSAIRESSIVGSKISHCNVSKSLLVSVNAVNKIFIYNSFNCISFMNHDNNVIDENCILFYAHLVGYISVYKRDDGEYAVGVSSDDLDCNYSLAAFSKCYLFDKVSEKYATAVNDMVNAAVLLLKEKTIQDKKLMQ